MSPLCPQLLNAVGEVRKAVMVYPDEPVIPPPPDMSSLTLNGKDIVLVRINKLKDRLPTSSDQSIELVVKLPIILTFGGCFLYFRRFNLM